MNAGRFYGFSGNLFRPRTQDARGACFGGFATEGAAVSACPLDADWLQVLNTASGCWQEFGLTIVGVCRVWHPIEVAEAEIS